MFIKSTVYFSGPAMHRISMVPITPTLDIASYPIMIWQGINANTIVNAVVIISDAAFTDGTDPLKYSLEIHTQDTQAPVTTDTRLITNLGVAPVTAGAADAYTYFDLGRQLMIPVKGLVKKALGSPSTLADARLGDETYDLVIRSNAKARQSGNMFINILAFQVNGPTFVEGADGSCCTTGYTPSSN